MEDKFKKLNKFSKEISDNHTGVFNTFAGDLFKSAPWFLSDLKLVKRKEIKVLLKDSLKESKDLSEKEITLNSLYNYADSETQKNKTSVKIEGDKRKLVIKEAPKVFSSSIKEVFNCDLDLNRSQYLQNLKECHKCHLDKKCLETPKYIDPKFQDKSIGNLDILFVGDYPKISGESVLDTFTTDSGNIVKRMIEAMKLDPSKWMITNILKCHHEELDVFKKKEMAAICLEHIKKEILILRPKVVISFGAVSTNLLLGKKEKLSEVHGKFFNTNYRTPEDNNLDFVIVPIFHPEFLLINPNMKRSAWLDLKKVIEHLGR